MAAAPRLFLVTPKLVDPAPFAPLLQAAVEAADVACVLIRAAGGEQDLKNIARVLAPIAQNHGAAALIEAEARLAARLGLDGVHVDGVGTSLNEALATLKPDGIVGAGGLESRDDAMAAGEAGVDYVMFGAPEDGDTDRADDHPAIRERVAWWAEIFNVPCVGYARRPELAGDMAEAGAEFVGVGDGLWDRPEAIAEILADVRTALRAPEGVR